MSKKRTQTIDSFFASASKPTKKQRSSDDSATGGGCGDRIKPDSRNNGDDDLSDNPPMNYSSHATYPFPIAHLPPSLARALDTIATVPSFSFPRGRPVTRAGDGLDLLCFEPFLARPASRQLFELLRSSLPFYRVEYDIARPSGSASPPQVQRVRTPRWTTVFGVDDTSRFAGDGSLLPAAAASAYRASPRPLPQCLEDLRLAVERAIAAEEQGGSGGGSTFNFCLVSYYASGADSIAYHSDDERFLGARPTIASLSLGATRDFLLKPKPRPPPPASATSGAGAGVAAVMTAAKPLKLPLTTGDMVVMRDATQANWLHSVPRRSGRNEEDGGRINITFRRARVKGGTENYYNYNVGAGPVYRWDATDREMKPWKTSI